MGARSGRSSYSLTLHPNFHSGVLVLEERVCLRLCLGGQMSPRFPALEHPVFGKLEAVGTQRCSRACGRTWGTAGRAMAPRDAVLVGERSTFG